MIAMENGNKCPACHGQHIREAFLEFGFKVFGCDDCGHLFSTAAVGQDYDGYFSQSISSEAVLAAAKAHERLFDDFISEVLPKKSGGKLLDVGTGYGFFVKAVQEKTDWQAWGVETSAAAVAVAERELGLKTVVHGAVQASDLPGPFDVITMFDVLEHVPDPDLLLASIRKLLASDGLLFIHTPNATMQLAKAKLKRLVHNGVKPGVHYLEAGDHVNVYTQRSARTVLGRNGFNEVSFLHLHHLQIVSGSRNPFKIFLKNAWHAVSIVCHWLTAGKANIDNLFIIAKK